MFKIIGSAIIVLASTMIGIRKYNGIFERKRILRNIWEGSIKIKENLRCTGAPLHESFLWGGEFFATASRQIGRGILPQYAVEEAANNFLSLTAEDRKIISRFAGGLNAEDCRGQISNLEIFIKDIERNLNETNRELETKGKLYVKGSILTAAAIVLLLI